MLYLLKSFRVDRACILDAVLWLFFKLQVCLYVHTRYQSVIYEKAKCVCFIFMQPQKEKNHICSNKHETGLVFASCLLKQP